MLLNISFVSNTNVDESYEIIVLQTKNVKALTSDEWIFCENRGW